MTEGRYGGRPARTLSVFLALGFVTMVIWACGPVMRERDQAAMLDGSLAMARDGAVVGRDYYNYDKQYASYWLVSGVLKSLGLHEPGAKPDHVVAAGNWTTALVLGAALLLAAGSCGMSRWSAVGPAGVALFTPVLAFSAPLLSSNMFSAAAVLVLTVFLRRRGGGWAQAISCGVLAWAAVAFRRDAALILPALCFLSTARLTVRGLAAEPRHWTMLAGAVAAVVIGDAVYNGPSYTPDAFFDWRLLAAYPFFGLAGAGVLVAWLVLRVGTASLRRGKLVMAAGVLSLLVPFGFYATVMTTPRHLTLTAMALLCACLLPRGRAWWRMVWRGRLDRFVMAGAIALSATLWFVGLRFDSMKSFRAVTHDATRFPTADGFWPAGTYAAFFVALANANETPVDHNQDVWATWKALDADALPPGTARVHSLGLRMLGNLALRIHGRAATRHDEPWNFILVPFRTVGRTEAGFQEIKMRNPIPDWSTCWLQALPGAPARRIYLASPQGAVGRAKPLELEWIARLLVLRAFAGDNVEMVPPGEAAKLDRGARHRIAAVLDDPAAAREFARRLEEAGITARVEEFEGNPATGSVVIFFPADGIDLIRLLPDRGVVWLAQTVLPDFMSKKAFPVSKKR